jgi:hypothetical protein
VRLVKRALALLAVLTPVLAACAASESMVVCVDDSGCTSGFVCAFGMCEDPNVGALGAIDLQIEPGPAATVPAQALLDLDPGTGERLDLTLRAGVSLVGEVLRGLQGVVAQVIARPATSVQGRALASTSTSEESGRFVLTGVEGERYAIAILPSNPDVPPLYDDVGVRADPGAGGQRELPPYAMPTDVLTVTGRVVAGDGASLQGIPALDVRLRHTAGARAGRLASSSARTAADGTFSLALGEAANELVLEVRATEDNEYAPSLDAPVGTIEASGDLGDIALGLVLSPVRFTALVLDDAGAPTEGAVVSMRGIVGTGRFGARATSNAAGEVELDVPPGVYDIVVLGGLTASAGLQRVDGISVPVEAGRLTVQLPPRARASGSVVDPTLGSIAAAGLAFVRVGDVDGAPEPSLKDVFIGAAVTSEDDGSFLVDLPPGSYRVNVTPPLSLAAPPLSQIIVVGEDGFRGDLVLPARAILAGTVLFDGQPVPDAYVRVFGDVVTESGVALQLGEGQAGPDGRFEIVVAADAASE